MTRGDVVRSLVSAMVGGLVTTAAYALTVRQDLRELRSQADEIQRSVCWMARQANEAEPPICWRDKTFSLRGTADVQDRE